MRSNCNSVNELETSDEKNQVVVITGRAGLSPYRGRGQSVAGHQLSEPCREGMLTFLKELLRPAPLPKGELFFPLTCEYVLTLSVL